MNWPADAEYEKADTQWLGRMPTYWRQVQLRHVIDRIEQGVSPQAYAELADEGWGVLKSGCVNGGVFADIQHKKLPDDFVIDSSIVVREGDLLVCRASGTASLVGSTAIVRRLRYRLILSDKTFRVRPGRLVSPEYLEWAMNSRMYREQVRAAISGAEGLANNLPMSELKAFRFAVPPRSKQKQIVDFLEGETGKIDALIAKQEQLIATLREDRTATITHAVTKGLDHGAPMGDSGMQWFGYVPRHWAIRPLGTVSRLIQTGPFGSQLHASDYVNDGVPIINPSHINDNAIQPNEHQTVSHEKAQELARHRLQLGDVIAARRGDLGRCAVVDSGSVGFICGTGSVLIRPEASNANAEYLQLAFGSDGNRQRLLQISEGSTMDNLNASMVARLRMCFPPISEQRDIVAFLGHRCGKIDQLIAKATGVIDNLREYRSALITDAVTGKIDVRDAA